MMITQLTNKVNRFEVIMVLMGSTLSCRCIVMGKAIGVLGAFCKGGQQFLSAKTQFCSAKK